MGSVAANLWSQLAAPVNQSVKDSHVEPDPPGLLLNALLSIQQRKQQKALEEQRLALEAKRQETAANQAKDAMAIQLANIAKASAAAQPTQYDETTTTEQVPFEERASASPDAAQIPDTPEERAAWQTAPQPLTKTVTKKTARKLQPYKLQLSNGQTFDIPLQSADDILAQKVAETKALEGVKKPDVQIPDVPELYGQLAGKTVPSELAAGLNAMFGKLNGKNAIAKTVDFGDHITAYDDAGNELWSKPKGVNPGTKISSDSFSPEDLAYFPKSWQDITEGTKVADDYTTRQGQRSVARDAATKAGRFLPDKAAKEEALGAQQSLTTAQHIIDLLNAPVHAPNGQVVGKVSDWFGPRRSRVETLKGVFGFQIPPEVTDARQALARFSTKDRHEFFGSALTKTETKYAAQFEPDLNNTAEFNIDKLKSYMRSLAIGLNSQWGSGRTPEGTPDNTPAPTGNSGPSTLGTPAEGIDPEVWKRLHKWQSGGQ